MNKRSKIRIHTAVLASYFEQKDGKVWLIYRFLGSNKKRKLLTPYKEIPVVEIKFEDFA